MTRPLRHNRSSHSGAYLAIRIRKIWGSHADAAASNPAELLDDFKQPGLPMQARPRRRVAIEKKAHELCGGDRLDLFAQATDRQTMDAGQQSSITPFDSPLRRPSERVKLKSTGRKQLTLGFQSEKRRLDVLLRARCRVCRAFLPPWWGRCSPSIPTIDTIGLVFAYLRFARHLRERDGPIRHAETQLKSMPPFSGHPASLARRPTGP